LKAWGWEKNTQKRKKTENVEKDEGMMVVPGKMYGGEN
jgi:hypothetical protein